MTDRKYTSEAEKLAIISDMEAQGFVVAEHHGTDIIRFRDADGAAADDKAEALGKLAATDKDMARGVEDLYQALIDKGVVSSTDLPSDFRNKIIAREVLRARL